MIVPLRVLAYTDATEVGGAEISLRNLLAALGKDVSLTVLATDERVGAAVASQRRGTALEVVPPVRDKFDLRPIFAHMRAVRRLRPHIFHANLRTPYSCQYGLLAGLATPGVSVVAVEHLPLPSKNGFSRWVKRLTSAKLAMHIAVGDATARSVEGEAGLRPGSIRTIWNGVFDPGVACHATSVEPPTIGSIGRLDAQKAFDVLVAALEQLPGVRCVLIGEGSEREFILATARAHRVADRVTLTGWLDDPGKRLGELDVFVLPSRYEGFPLVILEAMLAGVAVVATDVGGVREAVTHGVTGLLVPPEDQSALAEAIRRLIDDPQLRARLADAALTRAREEFTADVMARRYCDVYSEIMSRRI